MKTPHLRDSYLIDGKPMQAKNSRYHDGTVLRFTVMTVVWGVVGLLVGLLISAQLA